MPILISLRSIIHSLFTMNNDEDGDNIVIISNEGINDHETSGQSSDHEDNENNEDNNLDTACIGEPINSNTEENEIHSGEVVIDNEQFQDMSEQFERQKRIIKDYANDLGESMVSYIWCTFFAVCTFFNKYVLIVSLLLFIIGYSGFFGCEKLKCAFCFLSSIGFLIISLFLIFIIVILIININLFAKKDFYFSLFLLVFFSILHFKFSYQMFYTAKKMSIYFPSNSREELPTAELNIVSENEEQRLPPTGYNV
jgi:hypothetical protein